jgi:hypothetical protein
LGASAARIAAGILVALLCGCAEKSLAGGVAVNGVSIAPAALETFAAQQGLKIPTGSYWYDPMSGAWGLIGGPTQGFTRADLRLGGPLRSDVSGGGDGEITGLFINGREVHPEDAHELSLFVHVLPGRYWLDSRGSYGYEGYPNVLGNLLQAAAQSSHGGRYQRGMASGYAAGDGQTSYLFAPPN